MTEHTPETKVQNDSRYTAALRDLQTGSAAQAARTIAELLSAYPEDRPTLEPLLEQATLKADLGQRKISPRGSWWALFSRHGLRLLVVGVLVSIITFGLVAFYQIVLVPRGIEASSAAEQARLLAQARNSLVSGQYEQARNQFTALLTLDPENPQAASGLRTAQRQLELAHLYAQGRAFERAGDVAAALENYARIQAEEPLYRDVADRIRRLSQQDSVDELFEELQEAHAREDWLRVIQVGQHIRARDGRFEAARLSDYLFTANMQLATLLQNSAPTGPSHADDALGYFQNALRERPRQPEATAGRNQIADFLRGHDAYNQGNLRMAVQAWMPLYQEAPDMLDGALAADLFSALMDAGAQAEENGDYLAAHSFYDQAGQMGVPGAETARQRAAAMLIRLTPTPTPTPTPEPPAPPGPPGPPPPPTPTPTPGPVSWYPGWIAFRSDRGGGENLWVMRPDGTGARPVNDWEGYERAQERQTLAPNSRNRVYVESPGGRGKTNIYIWREDWPAHWDRRELVFDNGSINYDPAWSPDSTLIAFVSQVTGGDEIWVVKSDGSGQAERLTWNTWEWDKHPSWSPDGSQIVFWSNREVGHMQIWIMDADGSNQRNISRNEHNDWDPVWLPESFDE